MVFLLVIEKIEKIKFLMDEGKLIEAQIALELFLDLGPNNLEALKLKALLYSQKGLFQKEYETWVQIANLDPEDLDTHNYFDLHFLEEKEKFYFTDVIPGGGRRFLLHPEALLEACGTGFVSCLTFLILGQIPLLSYFLSIPTISFFFIGVFVVLPWVGILKAYLKMPADIWVTPIGFAVSSRLQKFEISWSEVEEIFVVYTPSKHSFSLEIFIIPKNRNTEFVRIEISRDRSIVKARRFFIMEMLYYFKEIKYKTKVPKHLNKFRKISF